MCGTKLFYIHCLHVIKLRSYILAYTPRRMVATSILIIPVVIVQAAIQQQLWQQGVLLAIITTICAVTGWLAERRGKSLQQYFVASDNGWLVTALILAACLPPFIPWWLAAIAAVIAMTIGKHLYPLGRNIFNPALVGYAAVLVSFPQLFIATTADAISAPTPLDRGFATTVTLAHLAVAATALLSGLLLLWLRIITWVIPFAVIVSCAVVLGIEQQISTIILQDIWLGGLIFAAFFVATDPITAPIHPWGKVIFAAAIGALTAIVRLYGVYPEGIAFAILIMNFIAPALDDALYSGKEKRLRKYFDNFSRDNNNRRNK